MDDFEMPVVDSKRDDPEDFCRYCGREFEAFDPLLEPPASDEPPF